MSSTKDCLEIDSVLSLVRGELAADVAARHRDHLDRCAACRVCVAEAARTASRARGCAEACLSESVDADDLIAGRYRLLAPRGRGASAVVWAAERVDTQERVALKLLHGTDATGRRRLRREADALTKLAHPHIVRFLEVVDAGDASPLVLVMELLEGPSLASVAPRGAAMELARAARILASIASALAAAHGVGLVHRDLKPANVLFTERDAEIVKVIDFGLAKEVANAHKAAAPGSVVTVSGTLLGTPGYMAPEQVFGARHAQPSMDVWALGVMTYELLSGQKPLSARGLGPMLKLLARPVIVPLAELRPDLPADVTGTVERMLDADPERRLGDLAEFLAAMARIAT